MTRPSVGTIEYTDSNGHSFFDAYVNGCWVKRIILYSIDGESYEEEWTLFADRGWVKALRTCLKHAVVSTSVEQQDCAPRSPAHPIFATQTE